LSVFGIYLVVKELLGYNNVLTTRHPHAILSTLLIAISPWHIQYSRAGFEVTELLAFLLLGLYFFFRALRNKGNLLWVSIALLTFTPWIYSTAKLFTPLLLIFIFQVWRKDIVKMPRTDLVKGVLAGLIIGLPIAFSTFFGGGTQRAQYTSVFTDPSTIEPEVGTARLRDAAMRGDLALGYVATFSDRFFHNKVTFWMNAITKNYLESISTDFLFENGDPNLRHSIKGMGQFYKIEVIPLILGLILYFASKIDRKIKFLLIFWITFGVLPAALTRDGGNHATRLILILPPLIFLISYGIFETTTRLSKNLKIIFLIVYCLLLAVNFVFYQHTYWIHNPWDSERWWHAGLKESIQSIKDIENGYDQVIISMKGEPSWIFFAAWYQYPPDKWQTNFPIGNDVNVSGFGKISHIDKFYFGTFNVEGKSLYDLPKYIDSKTLYMAVAKEMGPNLILEPERTPPGLKLVKAIPYPSGEPAYYLLTTN